MVPLTSLFLALRCFVPHSEVGKQGKLVGKRFKKKKKRGGGLSALPAASMAAAQEEPLPTHPQQTPGELQLQGRSQGIARSKDTAQSLPAPRELAGQPPPPRRREGAFSLEEAQRTRRQQEEKATTIKHRAGEQAQGIGH